MNKDTVILIPARMDSTRLPGKPLKLIKGKPMIIHVAEQAKAADIGEIIIATDHKEIEKIVQDFGFQTFLTKAEHASGSDRIYEALCALDPKKEKNYIINLQGDLPDINPKYIKKLARILKETEADIATLATYIHTEQEKQNPNIVKIIASPINKVYFKALYFTRAKAPYGEGPYYHHIGIYGYKRYALEKFCTYKTSSLEKRERLEQLRALENDMKIIFSLVPQAPVGVDTQEDLENIKKIMQ